MTDKDIDKAAGKAAGSRKEKDFLKDQMTHNRDADLEKSGTSLKDGAADAAAGGI